MLVYLQPTIVNFSSKSSWSFAFDLNAVSFSQTPKKNNRNIYPSLFKIFHPLINFLLLILTTFM